MAVPFFGFFALAGGPLLRLQPGLVLDGLLLEMIESFIDRDGHVFRLGKTDQWSIAGVNRDFSFMPVFFDSEDDLGLEFITQDFADFGKAGFYFLADGVGDFVLSSGVLHVHERPLRRILFQVNRALHWD